MTYTLKPYLFVFSMFVTTSSTNATPQNPGLSATPLRHGIASNLGATYSVHNGAARDTIHLKLPGNQPPGMTGWAPAASNDTDYGIDALFPDLAEPVGISALSTGLDIMPEFDIDGVPVFDDTVPADEPNTWLAIVVSAKEPLNAAEAFDEGSVFDLLGNSSGLPRNVGSDLVSYYFQGAAGINTSYLGQTIVEMRRESIGIPDDKDLDMLDLQSAAAVAVPQRVSASLIFPQAQVGSEYCYFSVTPEFAGLLDHTPPPGALMFAEDPDNGTVVDADPAVIYRKQWIDDGSHPPHWGSTEVFLDRDDLGLVAFDNLTSPEIGLVENIDALAVYTEGNAVRVIFSTQPVVDRSQLRVYQGTNFGSTGVLADLSDYHNGDLARVDQIMGLKTEGDLDAMCPIDPGNEGAYFASDVMGTPTVLRSLNHGTDWMGLDESNPLSVNISQPLGIAVARIRTTSAPPNATIATDEILIQVSGLEPSGSVAIFLQVYSLDGVTPLFGPRDGWLHLESSSSFSGSTAEFSLPLTIETIQDTSLDLAVLKFAAFQLVGSDVPYGRISPELIIKLK